MQAKEELLQKLSDCVFDMEDEEVVDPRWAALLKLKK